ncbi:hypothetical protein D5400_12660 [Georhizobium profundi]|uniref:Uncharacterized protein n=1 Tax=Georhizobium profundi TaxID=2341112 RepID=A0A3Q8XRK1_9HYPH|nr:hypothetical protein [Georhizobium profundi]AZN72015.1 hypothetical protein D5400_12660 [Georhizobium profundi]
MQHASYEIGTRRDEKTGEPLFLVDKKRLGTVAEVKALIQTFETSCRSLSAPYDPDRPATIGDIDAALDAFHVRNRKVLMGGGNRP